MLPQATWCTKRDCALLVLIMACAAAVRFAFFDSLPYMHDEISALMRTAFDGFGELINRGVVPDGHPAGTQAFLWIWTRFAGYAPWLVKLPFAIAGLASVWLIYLVAARLFGRHAAYLPAALLATSQYAVIYSQWARPYAFGLFVVLAFCYTVLQLQTAGRSVLKTVMGGVLLALAGYIHYFALLQAIIVLIAASVILPRTRFPLLIAASLIGFVLWLPHLPITLHHLSMGGIGDWLHPPDSHYGAMLVAYAFHYSWMVPLLIAFAALFSFVRSCTTDVQQVWNKRLFLAINIVVPYLVAFIYSTYRQPVLHQSVMLFALPFLYLFCASFMLSSSVPQRVFIPVVLAVTVFQLVVVRKHYTLNYRFIHQSSLQWLAEQEGETELSALLSLSPEKVEWIDSHLVRLPPGYRLASSFGSQTDLWRWLRSVGTEQIFVAVDNGAEPELLPLVMEKYPCIDTALYCHDGAAYLLSKACESRSLIKPGPDTVYVDVSHPFTSGISFTKTDLPASHNLCFSARPLICNGEVLSVVDVNCAGATAYWRGLPYDSNMAANGVPFVHLEYHTEMKLEASCEMKHYYWLKNGSEAGFLSARVYGIPRNPFKYKLFQPMRQGEN